VKVRLSEEAQAQARVIDAWWRENRLAAPDLFLTELGNALTVLEEMPTLGTPYEAGAQRVRRLLLRRTHYHLYFVERTDSLYVLAVWNAFRGRGPRL